MEEQLWCPNCKKTHWKPVHTDDPDSCNDCETTLEDSFPLWFRVKTRIGQVVAAVILGAIVLGPPAVVVRKVFSDAPLYATRTVEISQTRPHGVIPEAAMLLVPWALLMTFLWWSATGRIPPMRRM
jgi:hypothetical protein